MSDQSLVNLLKWLKTFDLRSSHSSVDDLTNGVALAEILTQIAPEWFTTIWYSKIKFDVGPNWRLKVSNLKKVIEAVMEYYIECLNQPLAKYVKPDAQKIAEEYDRDELTRLLQLVLGCAVNCNNKQHFITKIMGLEESVQQVIMQSIQDLENSIYGPRQSLGANLNLESFDASDGPQQMLMNELQTAIDLRDQMTQRCHELDQQLTFLQEERNVLQDVNEKLLLKVDELDRLKARESASSREKSELKKQVETFKEEIFKIETVRDDYKSKVDILEKEISELRMKQTILQKSAEAARQLKDEVDSLRETADRATKYETTIEAYKKKIEDLSNLKRQMKLLEDKNTEYIQKKIDFEEEIKRTNLLKNNLETCKKELTFARDKIVQQTIESEKHEEHTKKLEDQLNAIQRERDRLIVERDTLRETNEELRCMNFQTVENITNLNDDEKVVDDTEDDVNNTEFIPPAVKERIMLLVRENQILKLNQRNEEMPVQEKTDDFEEKFNEMREQNRRANQKVIELENKLMELQANQTPDSKIDEQKIQHLTDELQRLQSERKHLSERNSEHENNLHQHKQKLESMQVILSRKENDLAVMEGRYKKYVERAKSIIKLLDPNNQHVTIAEELMKMNDQNVKNAERLKKEKMRKEMEEKLIASALYNLGVMKHRETVDQKVKEMNSYIGQSFLDRHRKPLPKNIS